MEFSQTWARSSSLLFIDNPAGVGYSHAERDSDRFTNDISNQKDLLNFMF